MSEWEHRERYVSALKYRWLTPLYDPVLRWLMRETMFKMALVQQARIEDGAWVLDLGCGTATLTLLAHQTHPRAQVVGIDGDTQVLRLAQDKAARSRIALPLVQGMALQLPYRDGSFDRVLTRLVLHHRHEEDKRCALLEVWRILRPGGELHVAEIGPPHGAWGRLMAHTALRLEETADNLAGLLPERFRQAGFVEVEETAWYGTLLGTVALYRCRRPLEVFAGDPL